MVPGKKGKSDKKRKSVLFAKQIRRLHPAMDGVNDDYYD